MEEALCTADAGLAMEEWTAFRTYRELNDWREDRDLMERFRACIDAQKNAVAPLMFNPAPDALEAVSEAALRRILVSGRDVHGISSDRHISNVVVFNGSNVKDSIRNKDVLALRRRVDEAVKEKARRSFQAPYPLTLACSGHLWYPPGGYMGWHTNSGAPGWRMYLSYAEEPGKSFFRYRDPVTHEIVTSWDDRWSVRMFEIRADVPLWHAVYSDTHRVSVGYVFYRHSFPLWARWKCTEVVKACLSRT